VSRKIISMMLAICLVIGIFGAAPVFAAPNSGSCGNGVRWEVSEDKTTLTISGEGAIRNYLEDDYPGWYYYAQDSITKLIINNGVTGIGDYAFFDMCNIETVVIPASVTELGSFVFDNCENLKTIHFSGDEEEWEQLFGEYELPENTNVHFAGDEEYTPEMCFTFSNGTITGYTGSYTEVVIPSVINGETVTAIGDYAFHNNGNITSVVIPDTVTTISNYAFDNCYMLETIKIPNSVTTIGKYAFRWTAVKSIELPSKLTYISESMLNQTQLEYIKIPSGVIYIDQFAFYSCGNLKHVIIPKTVTDINYSAFHWSGVTDVYYEGTSAPTYIADYNTPIKNAAKHYNYTTPTSISMAETAEMQVGDCLQLNVTFTPSTASFTLCKWTSSNEAVATVDTNGMVTAYKEGEAVITATSVDGGMTASCTITTKNVPFTNFSINKDTIELVINEDYEVEFEYSPQNATINSLVWTSSNPDVAVVEKGVIRGTGKGTAVITGATTDGTLSDTISVTVIDSYGSGTLDNGMTWNIDPDRMLTISGTGAMPDYWINEYDNADGTATGGNKEDIDLGNPAPWYEFSDDIEGIDVGDGITSIGDYCFYNLHDISYIKLPEGLKSIGKNAFSNIWHREGLRTETIIPDSVETIEAYAFAHNGSFSINALPESLKTIGNNAFYYNNMSNTPVLDIPENVTAIGERAFFGTNVNEIHISAKVETIGKSAFANNDNLNYITIDSSNKNFIVENNTLYNADKTTLMLCADKESTFFDVPSTVTKIDDYAFSRMYNLTSINLTNSVKTIGEAAFQQCNISYIYLPEGLTSIGNNAFSQCSQLTSVTIPKSVESIGKYAFAYCYQLSQIILNNGLKTIGEYAFYNCLHSYIHIPASVTSIGEQAIRSNNLMHISVDSDSQSFTAVDNILYTKDKKILKQYPTALVTENLIVANGTEKIENNAFYQAQVKKVLLPETVKEIGNAAFQDSTIEFINLPESLIKVGHYAFASTRLTEVGLPNSLETITAGMFYNCQSLSTVTIGTGTKTIESSAFTYTSLCNLYINGAITLIKNYTFEGSNNLSNIFFAGTEEQWDGIKVEDRNEPFVNANVYYNCKNVKGIAADKSEIKMSIGETKTLSATIDCDEEETLNPWWTVIGDIVTVDAEGNIIANQAGSAVVVAHAPCGYVDICTVYVEAGGKCGENATWKFDGNNTLTISGTGDMDNYNLHGTDNGDGTITTIERPWMNYMPMIKTVKIESGITSIGDYAFAAMPEFKTIEISDTVTTIGSFAFEGSSLTSLHLPASVTTLKEEALSMCDELKEITVNNNNLSFNSVDGILYDKEIKTLIKIPCNKELDVYEAPATVTTIAPYAAERSSIKALVLPEGVTTIGEGAFVKSDEIMRIMLPKSVTTIGEDAFYGVPVWAIVYGGSEQQFNELVPPATDAEDSQSPLQSAAVKIYNSHDKVHVHWFDCYYTATGEMEVCAEVIALRPFTAVAAIYDNDDTLIATKVENVKALSDFAEFHFDSDVYIKGTKVRFLMLDSITSMQPVGISVEETYRTEQTPSTGGGAGGGSSSGGSSSTLPAIEPEISEE